MFRNWFPTNYKNEYIQKMGVSTENEDVQEIGSNKFNRTNMFRKWTPDWQHKRIFADHELKQVKNKYVQEMGYTNVNKTTMFSKSALTN